MAGPETKPAAEDAEAPDDSKEKGEAKNKVEDKKDVENKVGDKKEEADKDIAEDEADSKIDDGTEDDEEVDPEIQKALDTLKENGASPKAIETLKKLAAKDPETQAAFKSFAEKAEANPVWVNDAVDYMKNPTGFDVSDPTKQKAKEFVDSLTPKEKEIFEAVIEANKDGGTKSPDQKGPNGEFLLPQGDLDSIQAGVDKDIANLESQGTDISKLSGKEREMAAAKLMMDHGVNVTDAADKKFVITLPKTAKEAGWNKVFGTLRYFVAFFAEDKEVDEDKEEAKEKEKQKNAAKARVDEELKNSTEPADKKVDALIAKKTERKEALTQKIGKEDSADVEEGGWSRMVKNKTARLKELDAKKDPTAEDVEEKRVTKIELDEAKKQLADAKKEMANIDEDLKVLEEMKKSTAVDSKTGETPQQKELGDALEEVNDVLQVQTKQVMQFDQYGLIAPGTGTRGAEFGADYWQSADTRVSFNPATTQWEIRNEGEQWTTPDMYQPADNEARSVVSQLKMMNAQLAVKRDKVNELRNKSSSETAKNDVDKKEEPAGGAKEKAPDKYTDKQRSEQRDLFMKELAGSGMKVESFKTGSIKVTSAEDPKITVIVSVQNDGSYAIFPNEDAQGFPLIETGDKVIYNQLNLGQSQMIESITKTLTATRQKGTLLPIQKKV